MTLYEKIFELKENKRDKEEVGYLFCYSIFTMHDKRGKFVSKLKKDTKRDTLTNVQKNFMKYINDSFKTSMPCHDMKDTMDFADLYLSNDEFDSIEGVIFSSIKKNSNDRHTVRHILEKVGNAVLDAETTYGESVDKKGINYVREYNILLNYLKHEGV